MYGSLAGFDGRWRGLMAAVIVFGMNVLCIRREEQVGRREKRFGFQNKGVCVRRGYIGWEGKQDFDLTVSNLYD